MPDEFSIFVEGFVAPFQQQQFAERTPHGDLDREAVVIKWPDGREWRGSGIVHREESALDELDDFASRYTRNLDLLRSELPASVTEPPLSAVIEAGGHAYKVASQGSYTDETWMRLALVRKPQHQEKPRKRT